MDDRIALALAARIFRSIEDVGNALLIDEGVELEADKAGEEADGHVWQQGPGVAPGRGVDVPRPRVAHRMPQCRQPYNQRSPILSFADILNLTGWWTIDARAA